VKLFRNHRHLATSDHGQRGRTLVDQGRCSIRGRSVRSPIQQVAGGARRPWIRTRLEAGKERGIRSWPRNFGSAGPDYGKKNQSVKIRHAGHTPISAVESLKSSAFIPGGGWDGLFCPRRCGRWGPMRKDGVRGGGKRLQLATRPEADSFAWGNKIRPPGTAEPMRWCTNRGAGCC